MHEVYRRLLPGGLVRGWINPRGLREFLGRDTDGVRPVSIEILRSFATAGLEAIRFAGFRREIEAGGIITETVIGLDPAVLPREVARALRSTPEPSLYLPSPLPEGTVVVSSFRTEPEACLAWLLPVCANDPRGPLRQLEFWLDEIEDRSGIDPGRDLAGSLGDRGWFLLLGGDTTETVRAVAILEARDPLRAEETLLALRGWMIEHVRGRTLGGIRPRIRDEAMNGWTLRGVSIRTPFAELSGPAFLATDEHLVIGTDRTALEAGLRLLETREAWNPISADMPGSAIEHIRIDGPATARWLESFVIMDGPAHGHRLASAVIRLLAVTTGITADIWTEEDAVSLRGRIEFSG
jgi:hypothetical protein